LDVSGAYGWIGFATVMLFLLGCFHAIQGLVALIDDEKFLVADSGLVVSVDYTVWGWVHMVGGIIVVFAALALFTGRLWARIVGVVAAMASATVNIAFLSAYPLLVRHHDRDGRPGHLGDHRARRGDEGNGRGDEGDVGRKQRAKSSGSGVLVGRDDGPEPTRGTCGGSGPLPWNPARPPASRSPLWPGRLFTFHIVGRGAYVGQMARIRVMHRCAPV
jgi:hypothetical protein